MGKSSERIDRWVARAANVSGLWPLLPVGLVGAMTAYLAHGASWVDQFGAFGWWCAGLVGCLVASLVILAASLAWERIALASATKKWSREVDQINPVDVQFTSKRIAVQDLAHPVHGRVKGKVFTNCELLGPANIVFLGGGMNGIDLMNCDIVVARLNAHLKNTIVFENCQIVNGSLASCTLFIPKAMHDVMAAMPGFADNVVSYVEP